MNRSVIDLSSATPERKERTMAMVPTSDATPLQILAMAVQKGLDPATLDKMMGLQERWEANQARKAFEAAISEAKAEIKPVLKARTVDFTTDRGRTNYKYEDLALIAEHVDPILAKHGISYRYRSQQNGKTLSVTCILAHRDGHSEETTLAADNDQSGNKNSIQAIGSAATYLQRYTLKLALGLSAAKDDDARGTDQPATISDKQVSDLKELLAKNNCDLPKFLKWHKIKALDEIPIKNFDWICEEVRRTAKAATAPKVPEQRQ